MRQLSRTQEELIMVRKKYPNRQRNIKKHLTSVDLASSSAYIQSIEHLNDDEDIPSNNEHYLLTSSQDQLFNNSSSSGCSSKSKLQYSPFAVPTNTNSLAAEVFSSIAKDFRNKNSNL